MTTAREPTIKMAARLARDGIKHNRFNTVETLLSEDNGAGPNICRIGAIL
jgi:hypothetical protein